MKAYLEIVKLDLRDVVLTSPCGGDVPVIGGACTDPTFDE